MKKDSEMVTKLREYFLNRGDTDWNLYFDYVEAVSRDAEDFMQMRISDFLERCSA